MQAVESRVIHNLPLPAMPFVGRRHELAELAGLVHNLDCRLLTLVGPGGIGKTRLALEIAAQNLDRFGDGAYFVALEALSAPDYVVGAISEAVGYRVHEAGDPRRQLLHYLSPQNLLLILDNFEHLLDGVGIIGDILAAAPGVKILVTSREVLNLQEEWLWPVNGMRYPSAEDPVSDSRRLEEYSAIQLFIQNAQRIRSDFSFEAERDGVLHICALVEGMPLALELAAAWVRSLSCEAIAHEITQNLDFLRTRTRNVPPRHQSMRAVLDHSWALLSEEEQMVFRRLSVFRGGFTREAAAMVAEASLPVLTALVDKSLLRWDAAGRYSLHELIRQYGERQLKDLPDDFAATRERHTCYYMGFLEGLWADLLGSRAKEALQAIETEIDNIRPAWTWAVMQGMEAEIDRGLDSLWFFYDTRGWYREGEKVFALAAEGLITERPEADGSLLFGRVTARLGVLCNSIYQCDKAGPLLETALAIFRRLDARSEIAFALSRLGEVVVYEGALLRARRLFEEALALYEEIGDLWGQAFTSNWLSNLSGGRETRIQQRAHSLKLYQEIGSQWGIAVETPMVGFSMLDTENYQEAMRLGQEGLTRCQEIGIRWGVVLALYLLGAAAHGLGDDYAAIQHFTCSLEESLELRLDRQLMTSTSGIARVLDALGRPDLAAAFDTVAYHYYAALPGEIANIHLDELSPERQAVVRERSAAIDPEAEIERLIVELHAIQPAAPGIVQPLINPLTERELEILTRVSAGMANRDIAGELYLSTGTVKWYLSQIYGKLGVGSRTQAVARARELQLIN